MDERRKTERIKIDKPVKSETHSIIKGIDVSTGGIKVIMNNKMEIGEMVQMHFHIPQIGNKFNVEAKVVWQKKTENGYAIGLEFKKVRSDQEK
ncbi:MAG: PilZ domain-containing protein [Spirochaetes bacterium]|nr:PilZ domain-containing protein [Spirochaetota bacterium]